jgi:mRNA deadenylase 3'-5' endonuclease subunit Ccr4
MEFLKENEKEDIPIILCGDFNSLPNSKAVEIIKEYGFSSTYETVNKKENDFTNYTSDFIGTLDYIFLGKCDKNISLYQTLDLVLEKNIKKEKFLPSKRYPSDHLCLLSEFIFN